MNIRTRITGDMGWIIAAHGQHYEREFGFDSSFETYVAGKVARFFAADDGFHQVWIAEEGAERVASAAVRMIRPGVAFVNFVLVDERCRGQGVARQLMQNVLLHARKHGCNAIELETYNVLVAARELYRQLGFKMIDSEQGEFFGCQTSREKWALSLLD